MTAPKANLAGPRSAEPAPANSDASARAAVDATKLVDVVPVERGAPHSGAHWDVIAGERVAFLPERAAWWERARTLIIADVHLGKAEAMASAGAALNGGVLDATLERLGTLITTCRAQRVMIVGDLLHAPAGLTPAMIARVREWRRGMACELVVVPGNHDRRLSHVAMEWDLVVTSATLHETPFAFVHDPAAVDTDRDDAMWWAGHVHPCVWLGNRADALKLACFIVSERVVLLPAFSMFTGGVCVQPQHGDRVHAIADSTVVPLRR